MNTAEPHPAEPGFSAEDATVDPLADRLALTRQIEASLHFRRKALLALDLMGIEAGTREQIFLAQALAGAMQRCGPACGSPAPDRVAALRECQKRIRDEARLQAALLSRAQSKIRMLANVLAGPSVDYSSALLTNKARMRMQGWPAGGRS